MPLALSPPDRATAGSGGAGIGRVLLSGVVLLIAWGALAFGAVYPWAYTPLLLAAVLLGVSSWWFGRGVEEHSVHRTLLWLLLAIGLATCLQLVPLPAAVRARVSPATEDFLRATDIGYRAAEELRLQGNPLAQTLMPATRPLSIDPAATWRGLAFFTAFAVLLGGLTRFFGRTGIGSLARAVVGFGVLLATIGIVQKAVLGDHAFEGMKIYGFWQPRSLLTTPFGPYVNRNHFAGWMLMALPLALGYFFGLADRGLRRGKPGLRNRVLWLSSSEGGQLQLAAFAIVVMSVSLIMTKSRSGVGCFVLTMVIAGLLAFRRQRSRAARGAIVAAMAALLLLPLAWANTDLGSRFRSDDPSIALRRQAWSMTARIIGDFPLVGTGLNTYGAAALRYRAGLAGPHFQEAHNDYLQLLAEGGLLLGIPAVFATLAAVRVLRRRLRDDSNQPLTYWLRAGAAMGVAAIALQSLVEFSLQMPGNAVLFVVLCAAALHRTPLPMPETRPARTAATRSYAHARSI